MGRAEPARPWIPCLGSAAVEVCGGRPCHRDLVQSTQHPKSGVGAGDWSPAPGNRWQWELLASIDSCFSAPNYLLLPCNHQRRLLPVSYDTTEMLSEFLTQEGSLGPLLAPPAPAASGEGAGVEQSAAS